MKLIVITCLCISTSSGVLAQSASYPDVRIENTQGLTKAATGTYQFIVHDSKVMPAFTTNILYFIERERKQSVDVAIPLSDRVTLFIPSRDKVNSENFKALEEFEL